jgi:hypothetical protein
MPLGDPAVVPQNEAARRAHPNSEFGMYNYGILIFLFEIPHSPIGIPHLNCLPGPRKEVRLMVFLRNALPSGPGKA